MESIFLTKRDENQTIAAAGAQLSHKLGFAKLGVVGALVVSIVFLFAGGLMLGTVVGFVVALALVVFLWVVHYRVDQKNHYHAGIVAICNRHLQRIGGEWADFKDHGQEYMDPGHLYALDLDIVGPKSLFQYLNTTHTIHGRSRLATALLSTDATQWEHKIAGDLDFLIQMEYLFEQIGVNPQDAPLVQELADDSPFIQGAGAKYLLLGMPIITASLFGLGLFFGLSYGYGLVALVVQILIAKGISRKFQADPDTYLGQLRKLPYKFARYKDVITAIQDKQPIPALQSALEAMKDFEKINNRLSLVGNPFLYFILATVFLWEYYCAFLLENWKKKYAPQVADWFDTLGQIEAYNALAIMPHVCKGCTIPTIGTTMEVKATSLGHPLIQNDKRITNDVTLGKEIFIISGSNMSGKTTFMRTVGINMVLAKAGGFVVADSFRMYDFHIATSMRTQDDLNQGISTFYAELKRVKMVLDMAASNPHTLFLIDEIFKGTNSVDRLAGADAVIHKLEALGVVGMVSTHDLELCQLADTITRVANYSFREHYKDGDIYFGYKLEKGRAKTTNGRFLMEMIGL